MIFDLGFNRKFKIAVSFCMFFILITIISFAQNKGFRSGIMAGAVASQVDGDRHEGYNKAGFQGGIFLMNKFSKKTGFHVEMKYIQKGSRTINNPDSIYAPYYKLRLSYVEVPFLFDFYLKKKFMLETGTGFSYLFRAREDVDRCGLTEPIPVFKRFDMPFVFGVCYFPLINFYINFRFSYSIIPVRNHPANQTWYFDKGQYNNLLSFGMYLML